ncbi:unnamed protein product [Heligmosomoides polygyrus]|uniref:Secreted protein n=1 Tax=Heligmosomoides polygyrus TaxID=6339 RepID=A0A183FGT7_HELPZ|nr:unnamed protein product [Heligmosomoides polygyrus]
MLGARRPPSAQQVLLNARLMLSAQQQQQLQPIQLLLVVSLPFVGERLPSSLPQGRPAYRATEAAPLRWNRRASEAVVLHNECLFHRRAALGALMRTAGAERWSRRSFSQLVVLVRA